MRNACGDALKNELKEAIYEFHKLASASDVHSQMSLHVIPNICHFLSQEDVTHPIYLEELMEAIQESIEDTGTVVFIPVIS